MAGRRSISACARAPNAVGAQFAAESPALVGETRIDHADGDRVRQPLEPQGDQGAARPRADVGHVQHVAAGLRGEFFGAVRADAMPKAGILTDESPLVVACLHRLPLLHPCPVNQHALLLHFSIGLCLVHTVSVLATRKNPCPGNGLLRLLQLRRSCAGPHQPGGGSAKRSASNSTSARTFGGTNLRVG